MEFEKIVCEKANNGSVAMIVKESKEASMELICLLSRTIAFVTGEQAHNLEMKESECMKEDIENIRNMTIRAIAMCNALNDSLGA